MSKPRLRGLLLDLDGTLARSLPVMYRTYLDFLAAYGKAGSPEEFASLNGPSILEIVRILQERHGLPGTADDLLHAYLGLISDRYARLATPYDGALELLSFAERLGARVALVTSSDLRTSREFLRANALERFFHVLVTGQDVETSKPDPAIYRLALERLGVAAEDSLAVEDSLHGIRAAAGAGLSTLAMDPEGRYRGAALSGVVARVSSLFEVIDFIGREYDASDLRSL